jgi:hypothetical protein
MSLFLLGQKSQHSVPALPLSSCVIANELLDQSQAQFLCLKNEDNNIHLLLSLNNSVDLIKCHRECKKAK